MDDWDDEPRAKAPTRKIPNQYNLKQQKIEITRIIAANRYLTSDETNTRYRTEFGCDIPFDNFGYASLTEFMTTLRELQLVELPGDSQIRFIARTDYKYRLLYMKAVGGNSSLDGRDKKSLEGIECKPNDDENQCNFTHPSSIASSSLSRDVDCNGNVDNASGYESSMEDFGGGFLPVEDPTEETAFDLDKALADTGGKQFIQFDETKPVAGTTLKKTLNEENSSLPWENMSFQKSKEKQVDTNYSWEECFLDWKKNARDHNKGCRKSSNQATLVNRLERTFDTLDCTQLSVSLFRCATSSDLSWISKANCVQNPKDPFDISTVLYFAAPDMILCGTTFGRNKDSRFHLISRLLTDRKASEPLVKPRCLEIGQMYIADLGEFLARVIIISQDDEELTAVTADLPTVVRMNVSEVFIMPADVSWIPVNVYLVRLYGIETIKEPPLQEDVKKIQNQCVKTVGMVIFPNFHGVRFVDWISDDGKWFSESLSTQSPPNPLTVTAARIALAEREFCSYYSFNSEQHNYDSTLEPFWSRSPTSPGFFKELDDLVTEAIVYLSGSGNEKLLAEEILNALRVVMASKNFPRDEECCALQLIARLQKFNQ